MNSRSRRDLFKGAARVLIGASLAGSANARHLVRAEFLPFDQLRAVGGSQTGKRVFAHWHIFPISFDDKPAAEDRYADYLSPNGMRGKYKDVGGWLRERPLPRSPLLAPRWELLDMETEIRTAFDAGLDGFQFNIVTFDRKHRYWIGLETMLAAATIANLPFSIMLSIDCATNSSAISAADVISALETVAHHPNVARTNDGDLLLGAFAAEKWPRERWDAILGGLKERSIRVSFNPHFLNIVEGLGYLHLVKGASVWGGNHFEQMPALRKFAWMLQTLGKDWIAPVWPQDFRPKVGWFAEAENSKLFRVGWKEAIETNAAMVSISTWNDYSEHSEIEPSTGIQYSFIDLTSYYAMWFKTGNPPEIVRDVLYYFHRIEATDAVHTGSAQTKRFRNRFNDPTKNEIELLAFLTSPGRIEINTVSGTTATEAQKWITSLRAPLAVGRPEFRLLRAGKEIISFRSDFLIRDASPYQDLLYRGGSSSRSHFQ